MSDRLTPALVAAAIFATGLMAGTVLISVVGPEPEVITRTQVTTMPAPPPRTLPPRTIEVTRIVERASRASQRVTVPERTVGQRLTGWQLVYWERAQVWARSSKARAVIDCESSNRVSAVSRTGKFRGLWQMDADFWASYGGRQIAARPDLAPRAAQNYVAYRGFVSRGWTPWQCA